MGEDVRGGGGERGEMRADNDGSTSAEGSCRLGEAQRTNEEPSEELLEVREPLLWVLLQAVGAQPAAPAGSGAPGPVAPVEGDG